MMGSEVLIAEHGQAAAAAGALSMQGAQEFHLWHLLYYCMGIQYAVSPA